MKKQNFELKNEKICQAFLELKKTHPFVSKSTKNVQFREQEEMQILEETCEEREIFGY